MKKIITLHILIFITLVLTSCATNRAPIPMGEIPRAVSPSSADEQYGHEMMVQLTEKYELDYNDPNYQRIVDIVDRLSTAIDAQQDPWHIFLFNAPDVKNAGATRGNHMFIWSGIIPTTKSDAELATILSHEMAHIIAGHVSNPAQEQRQTVIEILAVLASIGTGIAIQNPTVASNVSDLSGSLVKVIGNELFVNEYSRQDEMEADHIGLMIMAKAKYSPSDALVYWQRMESDAQMAATIKYFTTHPTTKDRIANLENALPLAQAYYRGEVGNPSKLSVENKYNIKNQNVKASDQIVISKPLALYRSPTAQSPKTATFQIGETLDTRECMTGWLEVTKPRFGYIKTKDVK